MTNNINYYELHKNYAAYKHSELSWNYRNDGNVTNFYLKSNDTMNKGLDKIASILACAFLLSFADLFLQNFLTSNFHHMQPVNYFLLTLPILLMVVGQLFNNIRSNLLYKNYLKHQVSTEMNDYSSIYLIREKSMFSFIGYPVSQLNYYFKNNMSHEYNNLLAILNSNDVALKKAYFHVISEYVNNMKGIKQYCEKKTVRFDKLTPMIEVDKLLLGKNNIPDDN